MFSYEFIDQEILDNQRVQVNYRITDTEKTNRSGNPPVFHHSFIVHIESPEELTQEQLEAEIESQWQGDASTRVDGYEALWLVV